MRNSAHDLNETFAPGDVVVYPGHGVGRVISIETQRISDQEMRLFVISFEQDRMTLRVPLHKAKTSGLRGISTPQVMEAALAVLKEPAGQKRVLWNRQAVEYATKINSGNLVSLAEVVRDLHPSTEKPEQSHSKREIYGQALTRLVHEVAAIDRTHPDDATKKLGYLLDAA